MGIIEYAAKKTLSKIGEKVSFYASEIAMQEIDKFNESTSLTNKVDKLQHLNVSTKSFGEKPTVYRLTMIEKIVSVRRNYTIKDASGNTLYIAKSEGLPKMPEMGLYKPDGNKVGRAEKGFTGNPMFTLYAKDKHLASLHQKITLKPTYDIPENGWKIESGISKTTVFDNNGEIAIQIQYMLSSSRSSAIVEFTNEENEVPALLIALAMIIAFHL